MKRVIIHWSAGTYTATTIVCPATTAIIWRVTAGYYVAL